MCVVFCYKVLRRIEIKSKLQNDKRHSNRNEMYIVHIYDLLKNIFQFIVDHLLQKTDPNNIRSVVVEMMMMMLFLV